MAKGIFITGTDTGIGKTLVSGLIMDQLAAQDYRVAGMKPVASGAESIDGRLRNSDALLLMQHSNISVPYELVNPYCFEPAIAPHIAASQANQNIEMQVIRHAYSELSQLADWIVVEGVGGWNVPINDWQRVADIPSELGLPVIMVVGMKLGCLNHAMLTAEAILASGNNLLGWVANRPEAGMAAYEANIEALNQLLECPQIGTIPHLDSDKKLRNQDIIINIEALKA